MERRNINYRECITWSTDAFYRETPAKIKARKAEGCSVVDMECSALAACAKFRDADYGHIIFTADSLVNLDSYDVRGWGKESFVKALELCLDLIRDFCMSFISLYQTHQMLHNYAHNSDCSPAAGSEDQRFSTSLY